LWVLRHQMWKKCILPGFHFFLVYTLSLPTHFQVNDTRIFFFKSVSLPAGWFEINIQSKCNFFGLSFKDGTVNWYVKTTIFAETILWILLLIWLFWFLFDLAGCSETTLASCFNLILSHLK
jgi:hypothetical protein